MPNTINLRLLDNKNIIAELNGIPLAQENSYKIIAGEENATIFNLASKPTQYKDARYTVEMVNSQGYGIAETDIIDDTFALPIGMAVAGYGWVQIRAYLGDEKVPFMTLKVKVWNTLPNWKDGISSGSSVDLSAYQTKVDNSLNTNNKTIVGAINEVNAKPSGESIDVQINGVSIVEDGVANIPLDTKVDKSNTPLILYGTDAKGNQTAWTFRYSSNTKYTVAGRDGNGNIPVGTAVKETDATNKEYVDNATKLYRHSFMVTAVGTDRAEINLTLYCKTNTQLTIDELLNNYINVALGIGIVCAGFYYDSNGAFVSNIIAVKTGDGSNCETAFSVALANGWQMTLPKDDAVITSYVIQEI